MKSLHEFITETENNQLLEKVLSPGLNPAHEKFREQHRQEIHDMLQRAYSHPSLGGYGGIPSGTPEESKTIHNDISNSLIKMVRRNGKITAVRLYKPQHGRKSIATATDGTEQGKKDLLKTYSEDITQKRSWAEVSGAPEHLMKKLGAPTIPTEKMQELLPGKKIKPVGDKGHYERNIGGSPHVKVGLGYPKD